MPPAANRVLDAGWRAAAYCLHPRVIGWSLLPLLIAALLTFGLAWFFWEPAVSAVRASLEDWRLVDAALRWLDRLGLEEFRSVIAPAITLALVLPLVMALSIVLVAATMAPALTRLVAERRFPKLERLRGGSFIGGLFGSLGATFLALLLLLLSMPFWLIPLVALVVPPLIWGWLTCRVFAYDVLADHASAEERRQLMREQRWPLLGIGVLTGFLGAAPALIFAFGVASVVLAPLLLPFAIWLYMLVFAFSALWFAHFGLAALQALRQAPLEVPARVIDPVQLPQE
ncbi:EI24 domain-containing protein [Inhella proteolytica]|uniref:EI24 domain-containing protein n=1 Tax=Inhella proteolytica TaxID=2795029 RepID=A0A931J467_9BURK|nr:EI24 domain-containing protein [Inhella proteolytica]MBH9577900.1 EI24 domain-containing protein [Inhella proteolytica]